MTKTEKLERMLLAVLLCLLAFALLGPHIAQPAHQHAFADQRMWLGIPSAMDVLSNLSFAAWGVTGLALFYGLVNRKPMDTQHILTGLFFAGLVCTAVASSWYHLQPDDAGLGIDRLGMVLAFAGLLGLAIASRISHRAGAATAIAVMVLGPLSIWFWLVSGNALAWLVIQFGGMALVLWMALVNPRHGGLVVRWGWVVVIYAVAKLIEMADAEVYELTRHLVSGHSLKHFVASFAAWPVVAAFGIASGACRNQGKIIQVNSDESLAH